MQKFKFYPSIILFMVSTSLLSTGLTYTGPSIDYSGELGHDFRQEQFYVNAELIYIDDEQTRPGPPAEQPTPLFVAAVNGDINEVTRLLRELENHPERVATERWNRALTVAARDGYFQIVHDILHFWVHHPELREDMPLEGNFAMAEADEAGHLEVVRTMFLWGMRDAELRPLLISQEWDTASPLFVAVRNGDYKLVSFILQFAVEHPELAQWVLIGGGWLALYNGIDSGDGAAETVRVIMESPFADQFLRGIRGMHDSARRKILNAVRSYDAAKSYL